jgi:hypothetical protein
MECLIIILVVSMTYFIFPSKKNDKDSSDIDGGTYGVADFNYNSPSFPYDAVVKKKTRKKSKKAENDVDVKTKKVLPKKIKKKSTKKKVTKK